MFQFYRFSLYIYIYIMYFWAKWTYNLWKQFPYRYSILVGILNCRYQALTDYLIRSLYVSHKKAPWWSSAGDPFFFPREKNGWSECFKQIGRSDCRYENSRVLTYNRMQMTRIPFKNRAFFQWGKGAQWPKVNAQMSTHKTWKDIQVLRSSCEHWSKPLFRITPLVSPFWNHLDVRSCLFHRRIARAKSNCFQDSWN